ncbi:MAG: hypothetical protein R3A48_08355 [Polyangiales bacterium]
MTERARSTLPALRPEALLALAFFAVTALVGLSGRLADDEGYLTFIGASVVAREPLAGLFFQKIHPSTSALFAPFAAVGWRVFLTAHAAAAALAVYFLGGVARRLGRGPAWLPPLLLACSPLYLLSAATGQSNSTAVLFFVGALALLDGSPRARVVAGALAAAGLWSRYEQAPYLLALVLFDVVHRRRAQALAGFAAAAGVYVVAGALYHGSALWLVTRPPVLLQETAPTTMSSLALDGPGVASLLSGFFLLTPLALAPLLLRPSTMHVALRWLAVTLALALSAQLALPQLGRLFNYDYTARYFLCHLPVIALLVGEAVADERPAARRAIALGVVGVALAFTLPRGPYGAAGAALFAAPWLTLLLPRRAVAAAACALAGVLAAPSLSRRHTSARPIAGLSAAVDALERAPRDAAVYTNLHQLQAALDARGSARRVRFLVGYDMLFELGEELGGRHSAQSAAVFRALRPVLYGDALWPCEFPHRPPVGSYLVLARSERASEVYSLRPWILASERVTVASPVQVWRVRREVTVPRRPLPGWMPESSFALPCASESSR